MAGLAMVFDIIARDRASKTFKDVGSAAKGTGKDIETAGSHGSKFGEHMRSGMKVAAVGLAVAGTAAVAFGKQSVDAFSENTKAAMSMQRAIGGSIEDASRLNFAARESGVSQEAFAKSIKLLEKNTVSFNGKVPAAAGALKALGISAKDSHGQMKPMSQLIPELADRFAKMPNGAEKSAIALKLFGKGGLEMLPMLNRGKQGVTDLMKESDKFGLTVGDKNVKDMKANIVQQRQWHAMMDGIKVQIGGALLPIITSLTGSVRGKLTPAIQSATKFLIDHKDSIANVTAFLIKFAPQILIVAAGIKVLTTVTGGITSAVKLFGIVSKISMLGPVGLIITAIALLALGLKYAWDHSETFRKVCTAAFQAVQDAAAWMWNHVIAPVVRFFIAAFATMVDWVGNLFDALSHVPGFGWAKDLADKLHGASGKANELSKSIKDIPPSHNTNITVNTAAANKEMKTFFATWAAKSLQVRATAHITAITDLRTGGGSGGSLTGGGPGKGFLNPFNGVAPGFPWGHYPSGGIHRALDFPVPIGTPVHSGEAATVMVAGWDTTGFGNVVRTHDSDGNYTIYGHNSRLAVHAGQRVTRGQLLAFSGSTGNSTGPHAHVERRHILYDPSTAFNFTSQLTRYAAGVIGKARAGWSLVGEGGPELAYLPVGSHVIPEDKTRGILNRVENTRSTMVVTRLAPEDLRALEQAVYEGARVGAREGAERGTHDGSYSGTREGAADGIQGAVEGARRGTRAMTGAKGS